MRTRRRKLILLALGLGLVLGLCAILIPSGPPDPVYQGKRLSYWLSQHTTWEYGGFMHSKVRVGGKGVPVDTNAIPYLVHALELSDGPLQRRYKLLWPKLPARAKACLPEPRNIGTIRLNAMFYVLDLNAINSPTVVRAVARTIEKSDDAKLKWLAADFVQQGRSKDPVVIQALVHGLGDIDPGVRIVCTNALRQLDPAALTNAVTNL